MRPKYLTGFWHWLDATIASVGACLPPDIIQGWTRRHAPELTNLSRRLFRLPKNSVDRLPNARNMIVKEAGNHCPPLF